MAKQSIYESKHWKAFRKALLEDKDCTCYLCNKKKWKWLVRKEEWKSVSRFHVHHLNYDHIGEETTKDVVTLCPSCHDLLHSILRRKPDSPFISELQAIVTNYIGRIGDGGNVLM